MAENNDMQVPEPEGPPVMSDKAQEAIQQAGKVGLTVIIGGAAAFLLLSVTTRSTSGALRSQQVRWQERQAAAMEEVARQRGQAERGAARGASDEAEEGSRE